MLVLRCKQGETVVIGEGIEVSVLSISGGRAKLGITAAAAVPVYRKDHEATRNHNKLAALSPSAVEHRDAFTLSLSELAKKANEDIETTANRLMRDATGRKTREPGQDA